MVQSLNEFGQNGGHAVTTIPKLDWFSTTWCKNMIAIQMPDYRTFTGFSGRSNKGPASKHHQLLD